MQGVNKKPAPSEAIGVETRIHGVQFTLFGSSYPLTAYIRIEIATILETLGEKGDAIPFSIYTLRYAYIVCSIIPIIIIYPKLQKYFAAGVNVGGVKE